MPLPVTYTISSGLPESFVKNSIQNILENDTKKLKREEREPLAILEADFVGLIRDKWWWNESLHLSLHISASYLDTSLDDTKEIKLDSIKKS